MLLGATVRTKDPACKCLPCCCCPRGPLIQPLYCRCRHSRLDPESRIMTAHRRRQTSLCTKSNPTTNASNTLLPRPRCPVQRPGLPSKRILIISQSIPLHLSIRCHHRRSQIIHHSARSARQDSHPIPTYQIVPLRGKSVHGMAGFGRDLKRAIPFARILDQYVTPRRLHSMTFLPQCTAIDVSVYVQP